MGWVTDLEGKSVGVDTAPLIYFIEEHPDYAPIVDPFFDAVAQGRIRVMTSTITLLEVLVHPLRCGDEALAQKYNDILLSSPNISTFPVTPVTAQVAAELRGQTSLKTADAIQLATAIDHGTDAFLTNDRNFPASLKLNVLTLKDLRQ